MRHENARNLMDSELAQVSGGRPAPTCSPRDYMPLFGNAGMNEDPDELSQVESVEI